jgi:hypothetical protein
LQFEIDALSAEGRVAALGFEEGGENFAVDGFVVAGLGARISEQEAVLEDGGVDEGRGKPADAAIALVALPILPTACPRAAVALVPVRAMRPLAEVQPVVALVAFGTMRPLAEVQPVGALVALPILATVPVLRAHASVALVALRVLATAWPLTEMQAVVALIALRVLALRALALLALRALRTLRPPAPSGSLRWWTAPANVGCAATQD